jgi:uncharacterized membrane protein YtjA (UPF0391 family)
VGYAGIDATLLPIDTSARYLAFHGTIVLFIGLLCGSPYGRAINQNYPPHIVAAWRFAHSTLPFSAMLMFAIAALLSAFAVTLQVKWFIAWTLIVSSYAFCISLPLAAVIGHRGLAWQGPWTAKLVFIADIIGAVISVFASLALIYASYMTL